MWTSWHWCEKDVIRSDAQSKALTTLTKSNVLYAEHVLENLQIQSFWSISGNKQWLTEAEDVRSSNHSVPVRRRHGLFTVTLLHCSIAASYAMRYTATLTWCKLSTHLLWVKYSNRGSTESESYEKSAFMQATQRQLSDDGHLSPVRIRKRVTFQPTLSKPRPLKPKSLQHRLGIERALYSSENQQRPRSRTSCVRELGYSSHWAN